MPYTALDAGFAVMSQPTGRLAPWNEESNLPSRYLVNVDRRYNDT